MPELLWSCILKIIRHQTFPKSCSDKDKIKQITNWLSKLLNCCKILKRLLQDWCKIVTRLLQDCCNKIVTRLLEERCKINSWSNNFLLETQHNLTKHNLTSHLKCNHLFKAWSRLLQDCYKIIARLLQQDCYKIVARTL